MPVNSKNDIFNLFNKNGLAIADVISFCERKNGGASDSYLYDIEWNKNRLGLIQQNTIKTVIFTSKHVKRWFRRLFPDASLHEVVLIVPSGQGLRGPGHSEDFITTLGPINGHMWWQNIDKYSISIVRGLN
jgi:G:T/U-mismatch repair DNA glycosylase